MAITVMESAMRAICLTLLLWTTTQAQSTSPSNDTSELQGNIGFLMSTTLHNMASTIKLLPLTNNAGLVGTQDQLQAINPAGPLFLTSAGTVNQLPAGGIAYISCEPSDYSGPIDAPRTINLAAGQKPAAIVLYSKYASLCGFTSTSGFPYTSIYTTEDANSSSAVLTGLAAASPPNPNTTLHVDLTTVNGTGGGGGGSVLGRSPTTAVAMIILYSITGIITALFLIIIVVGAIRAHRHPERYGPRRVMGRQRQSRARGIARAMLETLPIVKFGDPEDENKPAGAGTDTELGVVHVEHAESETSAADVPSNQAEGSRSEPKDTPEVPDAVAEEAAAVQEAAPTTEQTIETGMPAVDNGLACSVCVEDFEKGQDVRVLPCKHRFHPECIDPWLLNVSGTCPLCRTDLRPTASHGEEPEDIPTPPATTSSEDATNTAAFNETTRRNRRSRILSTLNIGHMRNATPEERLAALRMLRNEQRTGDSTPRSRNKFSQRLSRTFGSRPHSGTGTPRRNSGVLATVEAESHPTTEMGPTAEEPPTTQGTSPGGLSPTAEEPQTGGMAHLEEAHTAVAPHRVGSAHVVDVPRSSAEASRVEEAPPSAAAARIPSAEHSHPETPLAEGTTTQAEQPITSASTLQEPSDVVAASPETTSTTNPNPRGPSSPTTSDSPSSPNIAPFYSYR